MKSLLRVVRVFGHLLAHFQPDVSLFPVRTMSGKAAATALLALEVRGPHRTHFHFEHLLHRLPDFDLGGFSSNFEYELARGRFFLARSLVLRGARIEFLGALSFLGDDWSANDLVSGFHLRHLR